MKRFREEVLTYVNKVKVVLQNNNKFVMFLRIMTELSSDKVDYVGVAARVKEVFKGHEYLIFEFNNFLPTKRKIVLHGTVRFQEVVDFVNKVNVCFHYKQKHIYKAFLDVVNLYRQGHRTMHDLYCEVATLFEQHHDLLQEFETLISFKGFRVGSYDDKKENALNKKYYQGLDLCEKVQNRLCNSDDYLLFLEFLHYYSAGVISRSDLRYFVGDLFKKDAGLAEEFDNFFNCCENTDGLFRAGAIAVRDGYQSKLRKVEGKSKEKRHAIKSIQELDLIKCEDCTPSYWLLPEEYQIASTDGRSKLDAEVLNDRHVSRVKDYSPKPRRRDKHQEILFRCEDDRFELDMVLESVKSTAECAKDLLKSIKENKITLETPIDIKTHFTVLNLKCIERLYGDHGFVVLDSLHKDPTFALPVVLTRLKQKRKEVERNISKFNKVWAEVNAKIRQQESNR